MKLRALRELLALLPDAADVRSSLFKSNGTVLALPINGVDEVYGIVHLK